MSGGSFDYLCFATDLYEVMRKRTELEAMVEELESLPWAKTAAAESRRLLGAVQRLESFVASLGPLRDVWHDIEWWRSLDYSEDQAREACRKFEELAELCPKSSR